MPITARQLASYQRSERKGLSGIGFNDAWNLQEFGITLETASTIRKAIANEYGFCPPRKLNLAALNRRLAVMERQGRHGNQLTINPS